MYIIRWVEYFYNIANEVKNKSKDERTQMVGYCW